MQHVVPSCHIDVASDAHFDPIVSIDTSLENQILEQSFDYSGVRGSALLVTAAHQWASATPGRIVTDPYSWMQAVHWLHGAGVYEPSRTHGPRFNDTTVRVAQMLADLSPCRPTIEYLMRRLKLAERTVQYHLDMLRESGLLAYIEKGSRYAAAEGTTRPTRRASHFAWTVPVAFDVALGIRTVGEGPGRRVVGIAEEHRGRIAELAKKAARKLRRPRQRKAPCTPMVGGTTHLVSSTSEVDQKTTAEGRVEKKAIRERAAKTASRNGERRRTILGQVVTAAMQAVGDKLAKTAYRRVPWVRSATHDQLRWVLNDAAGRGWDEQQTVAWLGEIASQYASAGLLWRPERPHALIAHALRGEVERQAADVQLDALVAAAIAPDTNAAWRTAWAQMQRHLAEEQPEAERTDEDRRLARAYAQNANGAGGGLGEVIAHIRDFGVDDAIDLYGTRLCAKAEHMDAIGALV